MNISHVTHDQLDSTQEEARRLAGQGAEGPLLVQAFRQSRGRGRADHEWYSPPGNVYATLLLTTPLDSCEIAWLPATATMAWIELLELRAPQAVLQVKWPNDLLVNGRKVGGQLVERVALEKGGSAVLVGTGLNLVLPGFAEGLPPKELRHATSLDTEGISLSSDVRALTLDWARNVLTFLAILETSESAKRLAAKLNPLLWGRGCPVRAHKAGKTVVEGILMGVTDSAAALIRGPKRADRAVPDASLELLAWPSALKEHPDPAAKSS